MAHRFPVSVTTQEEPAPRLQWLDIPVKYVFYAFLYSRYAALFGATREKMGRFVAANRRNIETLTAANRVAMEGAQAVARRNMEIMQQNLKTLGEDPGEQGGVLSAKDWSLLANDAWVLGGIHAKTEFHFASPLRWENLWAHGAGRMTVTAREAIERWVEQGIPPKSIVAVHKTAGVVDRTRPICPYPERAVYKGSGSTDSAENFICRRPHHQAR